MKPVKIFHLLNSFEIGGLEKLVFYFLKQTDFKDIAPVIGVLNGKGELKNEFESLGVPIYDFNLQPGIDLRVPLKIAKVLKKHRIDIVHTHNLGPHFYGSLAALLGRVRLKVHTEHGVTGVERHGSYSKNRYLDRKRDYIVAVSSDVESFLKKNWRPRCNLVTIKNGICLPDSDYEPAKLRQAREMIGAGQDEKIIGHVGRLSDVKDQATLLKAFKILSSSIEDCRLAIIGDGPLLDELKNLAVELDIQSRVTFLGARNDVDLFLSVFDLFVLSSVSEGISVALLEAMARGVSPVVTSVGGNVEVVEDTVNGLLTMPGDAEMLARKAELLLSNNCMREKFGVNAKKTVFERFSLNQMVHNYNKIYHSVFDF